MEDTARTIVDLCNELERLEILQEVAGEHTQAEIDVLRRRLNIAHKNFLLPLVNDLARLMLGLRPLNFTVKNLNAMFPSRTDEPER